MENIRIVKEKYVFEYQNGYFLLFTPDYNKLAKFPLSTKLTFNNNTICEADGTAVLSGDTLTISYENLPKPLHNAELTLTFSEDEITSEFKAFADEIISIENFEYFRKGQKGLSMNDCTFCFSPAPRHAHGHGTTLYKHPCNCSADGFFAPPPFILTMGNRFGKISFSLLDLPDSTVFQMSDKWSIIAEQPGGHKKTTCYFAPRLLITFPKDEWDALDIYYNKLKDKKIIDPIPIEEKNYPAWWKRFVVDSYGDQITQLQYNYCTADDWASPEYTTDWLYRWLENAEKRLARKDFNIVIDAYWQYEASLDPYPDKERFGNLRSFIDHAHAQGHKVLLWIIPQLPEKKQSTETLAEKFGVIRKATDNYTTYIDYTHDKIDEYMHEFCRILFGNETDCLDADGVKIDGPFCVSNPTNISAYAHPEKGIGVKELLLYYKLFTSHAREFKPDVLINTSTVNPFFEDLIHVNRLGDQSVRSERQDRARIVSLTSPNMLMDSDAVMNSEYIFEDYLNAVVYSIPYLYNTDEFLCGERPTDDEMRKLGKLLSLCAKKPWGKAIYVSEGNWLWETKGKITAASINSELVIVFSEDDVAYVYSTKSGAYTIPLFGRKINESEDVTLQLTAGEIATFALK